jgi:hypothetical protein
MLAADRAHTDLREFMTWPTAYREMYRTAIAAERKAEHELARKAERRQRMAQMQGGRGGRR